MGVKNKSSLKDNFKSGKIKLSGVWFAKIVKNPELFYNSDEFRKIKNRKKTNKR